MPSRIMEQLNILTKFMSANSSYRLGHQKLVNIYAEHYIFYLSMPTIQYSTAQFFCLLTSLKLTNCMQLIVFV